jgi:hypothetical protein
MPWFYSTRMAPRIPDFIPCSCITLRSVPSFYIALAMLIPLQAQSQSQRLRAALRVPVRLTNAHPRGSRWPMDLLGRWNLSYFRFWVHSRLKWSSSEIWLVVYWLSSRTTSITTNSNASCTTLGVWPVSRIERSLYVAKSVCVWRFTGLV